MTGAAGLSPLLPPKYIKIQQGHCRTKGMSRNRLEPIVETSEQFVETISNWVPSGS